MNARITCISLVLLYNVKISTRIYIKKYIYVIKIYPKIHKIHSNICIMPAKINIIIYIIDCRVKIELSVVKLTLV